MPLSWARFAAKALFEVHSLKHEKSAGSKKRGSMPASVHASFSSATADRDKGNFDAVRAIELLSNTCKGHKGPDAFRDEAHVCNSGPSTVQPLLLSTSRAALSVDDKVPP